MKNNNDKNGAPKMSGAQVRLNRKTARENGDATYQGKPCKYGHSGPKYTQSARCVECIQEHNNDPDVKRRQKEWRDDPNNIFHVMVLGAKHKNHEFSITEQDLEYVWEIQKGLCYYDGKPMERTCGDGKPNPNKVSIDRLDSSKGYTLDNIVLCKARYNWGKLDQSEADYIEGCQSVVQHSAVKTSLELFRSAF
jgi:hypothetical protein